MIPASTSTLVEVLDDSNKNDWRVLSSDMYNHPYYGLGRIFGERQKCSGVSGRVKWTLPVR